MAVSDVGLDTNQDRFLNEFVDKWTPTGHEGMFFGTGEFSRRMKDTGFTEVSEYHAEYKWRFDSHLKMLQFTRYLFALLDIPLQDIYLALQHYGLQPITTAIGSSYNWGLHLAVGEKPAIPSSLPSNHIHSQVTKHLLDQHGSLGEFESQPRAEYDRFVEFLHRNGWSSSCGVVKNQQKIHCTEYDQGTSLGESGVAMGSVDGPNQIMTLTVLVISVEQDFVFIWNGKENLHAPVQLHSEFQVPMSTPPEVRSFSVQQWTISISSGIVTLLHAIVPAPEDTFTTLHEHLIDILVRMDLLCEVETQHQNFVVICNPPKKYSGWILFPQIK